jgi:hypothetical protein
MSLTWAAGLALLTTAALSGCGSSPGDDAVVVPAAESLSIDGDEFEVMLPSGQFVFTVTEPRDELSESDAADGEAREAPDGRQYVGLEWDWRGMASRAFSLLNHDVPPQVAEVSVMTGDDELAVFELDTQDRSPAGRAWVLVSDDADPVLQVTYDGHTQTVDLGSGDVDAGVAEGFYDIATYNVDCPDQGPGTDRDGLQYRIECTVGEVVAVPYVADLGWADEGQIWLLVPVELRPGEVRFTSGSESTRYRVDHEDGSIAVGDGDPVELWQAEGMTDGFGATYAVPVPVGGPWQLEITRSYDLTRDGSAPGAPATEHFTYNSTVTFGS